MDAVLAKRNLAKERDTAQRAVDDEIQHIAISSKETEFSFPVMPVGGDINLSKLRPLNITSIITKEGGSITDVVGIPEGVKNVKFEGHLLIEAPQLPNSLVELNLNRNYIEKVDFSSLPRLKILRLNNNRIKTFGKNELPESLEELYLDNNQIVLLNLDKLQKLRILHCRNNRMMRIKNIPASLVDLHVEDGNPNILLDYAFLPKNAASEEDTRAKGTEADFVESMADYFKLKSKYETKAQEARSNIREKALLRGLGEKRARKVAKELRPKCVNCKRPVGTVFKMREDRLIAYCGNTKEPCSLKIEIFKGRFESDDQFADYTAKGLIETKEKIIRQKMDVLFNYASEQETVTKFKDLIEEYNLFAFLHKMDLEIREDKRFNVHKRELIKSKMNKLADIKAAMNTHMEEYESSGNRDELNAAMDVYIREYMPEVNNLRLMKYGVMEMVVPGTETETPVRAMNQGAASLRQLETLHGEVPKVLKFITGSKDTNVPGPSSALYEEDEQDDDENEQDGEEEVPFTSEDN
jgi:hypothetical protein